MEPQWRLVSPLCHRGAAVQQEHAQLQQEKNHLCAEHQPKEQMRQKSQGWGNKHNTLGIMGVTCNYFIALKIPELLVSVYRARARQGHKLQPLALAPNTQQSRTRESAQRSWRAENRKTQRWRVHGGQWVTFLFCLLSIICFHNWSH